MKRLELTGKKFNNLTVIGFNSVIKEKTHWDCICDCGNKTVVGGYDLKSGNTKSCGCIQAKNRVKHGNSPRKRATPEYKSYYAMIQRCTNENAKGFENYGGRGIRVCDRWMDFNVFLKDMGKKPSPEHSIERIEVNGNYEPSNCRWATPVEQSHNTRLRKTNKTGVKGVYFYKRRNRYHAQIGVKGKNIHLGYFDTIEEAKQARMEAEQKYWKSSQ